MKGNFDYRAMGQHIKNCRLALGMTQEELAEKASISVSFIGHIERGEKQPSLETTVNISKSLDMSMDYLVLGRKQICEPNGCRLRSDLQRLVDAYPNDLIEM